MGKADFANSYMITNRATPEATAHDDILPLPDGGVSYYIADGQYVTDSSRYNSEDHDKFMSALNQDVEQQASVSGALQLTIYIHGLSVLFDKALCSTAEFGANLLQYGPYPGLVIGFDWPCYAAASVTRYASSQEFPPTKTQGTIRDNINGSRDAFKTVLADIRGLTTQAMKLNLICHSEGNYMAMLGMYQWLSDDPQIDEALVVAADINSGAFQVAPEGDADWNAKGVSSNSRRVTVYYSKNDGTLGASKSTYKNSHNPTYPERLGQAGPDDSTALLSDVYAVDCQNVVNDDNTAIPDGITKHISYRYIPQVLQDMTQTMLGEDAAAITNRSERNEQSFEMQIVEPAPDPISVVDCG